MGVCNRLPSGAHPETAISRIRLRCGGFIGGTTSTGRGSCSSHVLRSSSYLNSSQIQDVISDIEYDDEHTEWGTSPYATPSAPKPSPLVQPTTKHPEVRKLTKTDKI